MLQGNPKEIAEELRKLPADVRLDVVAHAFDNVRDIERALAERERPKYVVGPVPPTVRILQPLYDRLVVRQDGRFLNTLLMDDAFLDRRKFSDGSPKTAADTNMTQDGQLGYPLEFSLRSVGLRFEQGAPEDVRTVLQEMVATLFFGGGTPWLRLGGDAWKPVLLIDAQWSPGTPRIAMSDALREFSRRGVWRAYQHNVAPIVGNHSCVMPDGSRHIYSSESFWIRAEFPKGPPKLSGPVTLKFLLEDRLYAQL